jgi:hypothetical protein
MHYPRTHPQHRPTPKPLATHSRTLGRHDPLQRQPEGRVQTSGFFDACVEVGERARLFKCDRSQGGVGRDGGEFGEETGKGGGVGEEAMNRGTEEDGGCVAAGGDVGGCPCDKSPRYSS